MKNWYAIYTNPRAEKKVAETLSKKGFENYLPLHTTMKQWSDRKKKVTEPLFKSYLFVKTDPVHHYNDILSVKGIVKFIRTGPDLLPVRDSVIEAIRLSLEYFEEIGLSSNDFKANQKVMVSAGPLKGHEGYVTGNSSNQYFIIRIEQLGTSLLVKIPSNYLVPA